MPAKVYLPAPRSKYKVRNSKADPLGKLARTCDGIVFGSQHECNRYNVLKLRQKAGEISGLKANKKDLRWRLEVEGELICIYEADFDYMEKFGSFVWRRVVEDAKGVRTPVFRIKKKLMKAIYGIEIREV